MRFMILWETDPKLIPKDLKFFKPPKGLKQIFEYVNPSGLFVEVVEAENEEVVFKYTREGIATCKKVEVQPALTVEEWVKAYGYQYK